MKTEAQLSVMPVEELIEFCDEIRNEQQLLIIELRDSRTQFPPAPDPEWADGAMTPSLSSIVAAQAHVAQLRDIKATGSGVVEKAKAAPAPAKEGDGTKPKQTATEKCIAARGSRPSPPARICQGATLKVLQAEGVTTLEELKAKRAAASGQKPFLQKALSKKALIA